MSATETAPATNASPVKDVKMDEKTAEEPSKVTSPEKTKEADKEPKSSPTKAEDKESVSTALQLLASGKRNLLVGDVPAAVAALADACQSFGSVYGETGMECGEVYFYYGKALLELARMETGVIENVMDGVPLDEGNTTEEEDDEKKEKDDSVVGDPAKVTSEELEEIETKVAEAIEENKKACDEIEQKLKDKEEAEKKANGEKKSPAKEETKKSPGKSPAKESKKSPEKAKDGTSPAKKSPAKEEDEKMEVSPAKDAKKESPAKKASSPSKDKAASPAKDAKKDVESPKKDVESPKKSPTKEDKAKSPAKDAEKKAEKKDSSENSEEDEEESKTEDKPEGESAEKSADEEEAKDGEEEEGDEEEEKAENESIASNDEGTSNAKETNDQGALEAEDEEDPSNLQLSWEMLELAKNCFQRHADSLPAESEKRLELEDRLSETFQILGEISIENESYEQAIEDLNSCLRRRQELMPEDSRMIAETHYQMGVAYGFGLKFDEAVASLNDAIAVLTKRIENLKNKTEGVDPLKKNDAFYSREKEISEIESLLPEIHEKIADTKDMAKESVKRIGDRVLMGEGELETSSNGDGAKVAKAIPIKGKSSSSNGTSNGVSKNGDGASDITHMLKKRKPSDEPASENGSSETKKPHLEAEAKATNGVEAK